MDVLSNPVKDYPWGSRHHIAGLTGRPSGGPEAEMWLGAHPAGPSRLVRDGRRRTLAEVIADDPVAELGHETVQRFGERLPYLVKLIAVDSPLSLQVHPTAAQAAAGHAAGDPHYADPWAKPEMIYALSDFTALAGLRPAGQAAELVARLALEPLRPVLETLREGTGGDGGKDGGGNGGESTAAALRTLLEWPAGERPALVRAVADAAGPLGGPGFRLVRRLAERYPDDPAVLAPLLLHRHELAPGQALFLGAGVLHSYVSGFGVEVMGASDNVLRAGLTSKPVDVPGLLRVLRPDAQPLPVAGAGGHHLPPAPEFRLAVYGPRLGHSLDRPVPRIVLCTSGSVTLEGGTLGAGQSAFLPAKDGRVTLRGTGVVFCAEPHL
ncbi:mannose-6-phosphate isomerase, class I [Planobispora rosea]|uniref:mannose-6-phosphate isomerase n=1 Tax=Planobispora rosea TaxID=35762 RepID=A0A8J3WFP7_PLARO|nr:mannose-6-phosphate isomerase, class I [Planobispora rosea]GGS95850.1 mannose-6-phosphate isomerase, class I [Planobispora rosea]GIH87558.1 mannose-6-phosphate isomerase, class I [Planobispora rosea]